MHDSRVQSRTAVARKRSTTDNMIGRLRRGSDTAHATVKIISFETLYTTFVATYSLLCLVSMYKVT